MKVSRESDGLPVLTHRLGAEPGQGEGQPAPVDCCEPDSTDLPDRGASENGPKAWTWIVTTEVVPEDDINLADGTVTDGGGDYTMSDPANTNDDDLDTYSGRGADVVGAGTYTSIWKTDLGSSQLVEEMVLRYDGDDWWTLVESSPDNSAWTSRSFSKVTVPDTIDTTTITLDTPFSARYWRITHAHTVGGLSFIQALRLRTWQITGTATAVTDEAWIGDGSNANDSDDATYIEGDHENVLLLDLQASHRIQRTRLRIALDTAGSKTYTIEAANNPDLSDAVTIETLNFTGLGSYTAQDVEASWSTAEAYRYWILTGPGEGWRVHSWELYESTLAIDLGEHLGDADDAHDASSISYDNGTSGLTADDVQAAIDELAASGAVSVLDDLTDVDTTGQTSGDVLTYDGAEWVPQAPTGGGGPDVDLVTVGATGASETVDVSVGRTYDLTLTANCTITLTGAVDEEAWYLTLLLRQDGTGSRLVTWPGSVTWVEDDEPTLSTTPGDVDIVTLLTVDGGSQWVGTAGQSTAALVATLDDLTDVNAASPSDGDVLTYDTATSQWVPAPAADLEEISDAGFRGELLISSTPSNPIVFGDVMLNSDGTDFVYASIP